MPRPAICPLTCIFVATTNSQHFLADSEHRRNPVLMVEEEGSIDLDWLVENREQLWAQAVRELTDEKARRNARGALVVALPPHLWAEANEASAQHRAVSDLGDFLANYLSSDASVNWIPAAELLSARQGAGFRPGNGEVSKLMAALGWERKKVAGVQGWGRRQS